MSEVISADGRAVNLSQFLVHKDDVSPEQIKDGICVEDRPRENRVFGPAKPGGLTTETVALTLGYNAQYPGGILRVGRSFGEWSDLVKNLLNAEEHAQCAARAKAPVIVGTIATHPEAVLAGMRKLGDVDENAFDLIVDSAQQLTKAGFVTATEVSEADQAKLREDPVTGIVPEHAARLMVAIESTEHYWDTEAAWDAGTPAYAANVGMYESHAARLNNALIGAHTGLQVEEGLYVTTSQAFVAATRENLPGQPEIVRV